MNKEDLILEGINLLILNGDLNQDLKNEFNKKFFNMYNKELEEDCCEMPEEFANVSNKEEVNKDE